MNWKSKVAGSIAGRIAGSENHRGALRGWSRRLATTSMAALLSMLTVSGAQAEPGGPPQPQPGTTVSGMPGHESRRATVDMAALANAWRSAPPRPATHGAVHRPLPLPAKPMPSGAIPASLLPPVTPAPAQPVAASSVTVVSSPPSALNFLALADDGTSIPPDTQGAIGPRHIMTTLNSQVGIQDRHGNAISAVPIASFWSAVGASSPYDPRVMYDPYQNRWIFTAADVVTDSAAAPILTTATILIGVSATDDPTGAWYLFSVKADAGNLTWADFPQTGFNKDWIVVQANMFTDTGPYDHSSIWVFDKATLYTGAQAKHTLLSGPDGGEEPAITYDNSLAAIYLLEDFYTSATQQFARVFSITGAVGHEVLNNLGDITVPAHSAPPPGVDFLPQAGTSTIKLDAGDTRMLSVQYRNGSLWATQNVFLPASGTPTRTAAQWWQINPATLTATQFGRIDDPTGVNSYAYPSIAVNRNNDVLVGYSRFSANQYASANYSFRASTDTVGTLRPEVLLKAGEGVYFKTFGYGLNRWGDYSATQVDPLNDRDFWTIQEYAATPAPLPGTNDGDGNWGTWWGYVKTPGTIPNDLNGDGRSDLVWRNSGSGQNYLWQMNGLTVVAQGFMPQVADKNWQIAGIGDLNGDGKADIVWRNVSTGENYLWLMSGTSIASQGYLPTVGDTGWKIVGVADVDGDGKADVVWRNGSTGENYVWLMNGASVASQGYLPTVADATWKIVGLADVDGNGKADLVWRNTVTGQNYLWLLNGLGIAGQGFLPTIADTIWSIAGAADLDGDGKADLVWRNGSTGENYLWLMNGLGIASQGALPTIADPAWQMVSFGDLNGDGKADITWRNNATGDNYLWLMNGPGIASLGSLPTIGDLTWEIRSR